MEFRVLGPVEICAGVAVVGCGPRQRCHVLAVLAADAGRPVTAETLIERVWDRPPDSARRAVHVHIARLRGLLERTGATDAHPARLVRRSGGYLLDVDPGQVDLHRFRLLVEQSREPDLGDHARAGLLGEALALWLGDPLAGLPGDWAERSRVAWRQRYLDAATEWAQVALRVGMPGAVVAAMAELVGRHPLVEPLSAAFMRALHAAGRDADALDHYARIRQRLVDELGADPGVELQVVHQAILRGDQNVLSPVTLPVTPPAPVVPATLPPDVPGFVGRRAELAHLDAQLASPAGAAVVAVSGAAGVGKSAFVLHWAHRIAASFPDGILYVDLRGDPPDQPVWIRDALAALLRSLGLDAAAIPAGTAERAAQYRRLLAQRRMLVVLDNADSADHIRLLLPASARCLVVVTSRDSLTDLVTRHGAHRLELPRIAADPVVADPTVTHPTAVLPRPAVGTPAAPALPPPGQLPRDTSDFTGRDKTAAEMRRVLTVAGPAVPVMSISGKAGIGKTALAVHVGHAMLADFADGQLYVSLRGVKGPPTEPAAALADCLRALGVAGSAIPGEVEERAKLYRSLLARRRVLVVLDDADSEAQVRPLLPGRPPSAAVVTSRRRLVGLEGAALVDLDLLEPAEALALLGRIAGTDRVADEPDAAQAIVSYCGRLPLAVRIAGARLRAAPRASAADLAGRLADEQRRLAELTAGDLDVHSSFALSYSALPVPVQRAFRVLGLVNAQDIAAWLPAAMLDLPLATAEDLLADLADAQLIDSIGRDAAGQPRYRVHDLLRVYAHERLLAEDTPQFQATALRRAAQTSAAMVDQTMATANRYAPAWLVAEQATLLAVVTQALERGAGRVGWQLATALEPFFEMVSRFDDWQQTQRLALAVARRAGDRRQEALSGSQLAYALWLDDRWSDAQRELDRCLPTLAELGEEQETARALRTLGALRHDQGLWDEGMAHLHESRTILQRLGDQRELAKTLCELGVRARFRNDADAAITHLCQGIQLYEKLGNQYDAASARVPLACAHRDTGALDAAADELRQALHALTAFGDRAGRAQSLFQLAVTYQRQGRHNEAITHFQDSLVLARQLGQRLGEGMILLKLGELHTEAGRFGQAAAHLTDSLAIFRDLDSPYWQGRAHASHGHLHAATGEPDRAVQSWKEAVRLLEPLGAPEAAQVAALLHEATRALHKPDPQQPTPALR